VDIAGAFDNTWHPGILARLWNLNCPQNIYSLVRDFLSERRAHVTLGNSVSSEQVTTGRPQGSVSGPTLWNIINNLLALLSNTPNVRIVVYADDIMIMIQGPSTAAFLNTLNNTLQTIEKWCTKQARDLQREISTDANLYKKTRRIQTPSHYSCLGNRCSLKNEISRGRTRPQAGLVPPLTTSLTQTTAYSQQSCPLLQSHVWHVILQPADYL
jgi:hypothetical protein